MASLISGWTQMKTFNPALWSGNHPRTFWQCQPELPEEIWKMAIAHAMPILGLPQSSDIDFALEWTLGEGQFGSDRYRLGFSRRAYYQLKPFLPRILTRFLRQKYDTLKRNEFLLNWPLEERFVQFLWEILRQAILLSNTDSLTMQNFWPSGRRFACVLTHDIEAARGQSFVSKVADLEEALGLRSSFNFVADLYTIDKGLVADLRQRGFEVGIHGLKHDGKLFNSHAVFNHRAQRINEYLARFGAVGFRSPLTLRHPEWMQSLNVEYDMSFFDTDPFEPMPGGTMSIWPFFLGHFVELPYTLVQDYTLTMILRETSARIWMEKVDFIEAHRGMVLVNSHPDFLQNKTTWSVYREFLQSIKERDGVWNALPRNVAAWWRTRAEGELSTTDENLITVRLCEDQLVFEQPSVIPIVDAGIASKELKLSSNSVQ
jgi:peptidoglycan/xylan/chitin deacetylase (PgdA/CDA1 family)